MWLGLSALSNHDTGVLGLYVLLGSTGVVVFIGWVWSHKSN